MSRSDCDDGLIWARTSQIRLKIGDRHSHRIAEETSATSNPGSLEGEGRARSGGASEVHEASQQAGAHDIPKYRYGR